MRKITIKYIVLFLSIAIGQLNASEPAAETPTYRSIKNKINQLWAEIVQKQLIINTTTASLQNLESFEQHIKNLQNYMAQTAIPWIKSKNKALFSNKYISRFSDKLSKPDSLLAESIEKIEVFTKPLHELITQQFPIGTLDRSIKKLQDQRTQLDNEYFFAFDKREARDITLLLYDVIISLYKTSKLIIPQVAKLFTEKTTEEQKIKKNKTQAIQQARKNLETKFAEEKRLAAESQRLIQEAKQQEEDARRARIRLARKQQEKQATQAQILAEAKKREEEETTKKHIKKLEQEQAKQLAPAEKAIISPEELELARRQEPTTATGIGPMFKSRPVLGSKIKPATIPTTSQSLNFPIAPQPQQFPSLGSELGTRENELLSLAAEKKREEEAKEAQFLAEFLAQQEAENVKNANIELYLRGVGTQRKDAPQELGQSPAAGKEIFGSPAKLPGLPPTPKKESPVQSVKPPAQKEPPFDWPWAG